MGGRPARDPPHVGAIRILPLDDVLRDGKGLVWFDHSPERLRSFRLVDFFADEAAVGFYEGADELHLYRFEGDPIPLGVDFERYAEMLASTRGYWYWQHALIDGARGRESTETKRLTTYLPRVFPDFDPALLGGGAAAKPGARATAKKPPKGPTRAPARKKR